MLERALGLPPDEITVLSNDPRFLTGVVPSGNVVTTANEFSRFFELLLRRRRTRRGAHPAAAHDPPRDLRARVPRDRLQPRGAPAPRQRVHAGSQAFSLFGPDTDEAFGHLGFTNVLGWADPERALSVGLMTSGKPMLHPALGDLWLLTRAIGQEAPKVTPADKV